MKHGCFVTGTDTEIGKTTVACGVLHALGASGLRVAGYKPVAAGATLRDGRWVNDDVEALVAAGNVAVGADEVCPLVLRTPCAPHIAAALEGRHCTPELLLGGASRLAARVDALVVEGVGGYAVPLLAAMDGRPAWGMADLSVALGLPVLLVVGMRLGCLNHALLTAEAIVARGLPWLGWVANCPLPGDVPHLRDQIDTLDRLLPAPCLGVVPHSPAPSAAITAAALHVDALVAAVRRSSVGETFGDFSDGMSHLGRRLRF